MCIFRIFIYLLVGPFVRVYVCLRNIHINWLKKANINPFSPSLHTSTSCAGFSFSMCFASFSVRHTTYTLYAFKVSFVISYMSLSFLIFLFIFAHFLHNVHSSNVDFSRYFRLRKILSFHLTTSLGTTKLNEFINRVHGSMHLFLSPWKILAKFLPFHSHCWALHQCFAMRYRYPGQELCKQLSSSLFV